MDRLPESINYHITERCNYCCKFCFARYKNHNKELSLKESLRLINILAENGCEKINFAGGEPTLIKHLPELINYSKDLELFVSIISNGTRIDKKFLSKCGKSLDIIGLSIDSSSDKIENKLGRCLKKYNSSNNSYSHINLIKNRVNLIKNFNIYLKINTTITPLNWNDDLREIILQLTPFRWKILEVHPIYGINDDFFKEFGKLDSWQFKSFIHRHSSLNPVWETSDMIMDSYCMITPDGCFFQDSYNYHHYSESILKFGALENFNRLEFNQNKFKFRKGDYFKLKQ